MTIILLNKLIKDNNIPDNTILMSDSGWECDATEMDCVWYNANLNVLVFTQDFKHSKSSIYSKNADWRRLL